MIVIGAETAERYFAGHAGDKGIRAARSQYDVWLAIAQRSQWADPQEVKTSHPRASILKGGRAVFNIKGEFFGLLNRRGTTQFVGLSVSPGTGSSRPPG